jgi:hypothetical protein
MVRLVVSLLCALLLGPALLGAQVPVRQPERFTAAGGPWLRLDADPTDPPADRSPPGAGARDVALATAASMVLPGTGQYLLREERWVPYVVVEAWSLLTHLTLQHRGRSLQRSYRDLAWSVARRVSVGERRDTVWEYYEAMAFWQASGAFDLDPGRPGVQPEVDPTTYNGDIWRLARALFIPGGATVPEDSPEFRRALDYYLRHAIPPPYAWAWGASNLEQAAFRNLIRESDEAFRSATLRLGILLANHVVSAVDAFVTARLRADEPGGIRLRIESGIEPDPPGSRWSLTARLSW